jgi:hypothetical protein
LRNLEPLHSTVDSATLRQKGQIDGVTRSSIRARACPAEQIIDDYLLDCVHLLVTYPVTADLVRPERLGGQAVGIQPAVLHAPQPARLDHMDPVRGALAEEPLAITRRGSRHGPDTASRAVPRVPEHRRVAGIYRPYQRRCGRIGGRHMRPEPP